MNNSITIVTRIATMGIFVGSLALFIVLSGFSGLRNFGLGFIDMSDPDIKIQAAKGKSFLYTDSIASLLSDPDIASFSRVIEERAFFTFQDKKHIAYIKGVDTDYSDVNDLRSTIIEGEWLNPSLPMGVVVGSGISSLLSVGTYDFLDLLEIYVPKPGRGYISNPNNAFRKIATQPVGIFGLTEEIDKNYVFAHLETAQLLLDFPDDQIGAIEIRVVDPERTDELIKTLSEGLGADYTVKSREQLNAGFYKMLNSENFMAYLISTLIVIIAFFNVIGALLMMILEKRNNLKTLVNLGATVTEVKRIFLYQGFYLSIIGMLTGLLTGITLVVLQLKFELFMITPHIPYPVALTLPNIAIVILTILGLGFVASNIASFRISKKFLA